MKIATLMTKEGRRVVGVDGTTDAPRYHALSRLDPTIPDCLKTVLALESGLEKCCSAFARRQPGEQTIEGTLLAPIPDPGKIICIGLNYRDHAAESKMEIPSEPVCFGKFGNTIVGPGTAIRLPRVSMQVDYEAELVVVIGKSGYEIPREDAFHHVAGYCCGHDVSARDWQLGKPGKQWLLGKTPDTFAPIGPWLVTPDEVGDPHALEIQLRLNGETMQHGNTQDFIFGVDEVISYVSQIMTLEPGDIIFTGTPAGVGAGRQPPVWLKPGDHVEIEIEKLGVLSNPVVAASQNEW